MYPRRVAALVLSLVLLMGGCTNLPPAGPEPPADQPFVLEPSVQAAVLRALKDYRPPVAAVTVASTREIDNKGNFGKLVHFQSSGTHERQDTGLWAASGSGGFTSGTASGSGQSLTLCGLQILLMSSTSMNQTNIPTVVPVGGIFVPFGVRSSFTTGTRMRVSKFETQAENICALEPGATFSYRAESEAWVKTSGLFGVSTSARGAYEVACRAAGETKPARELGIPVDGDALQVSCEKTLQGGKAKLEYVFARRLGMYFQTGEGEAGDVQVTKVRYESVQPRP